MSEYRHLPRIERIKKYREFADDARKQAALSTNAAARESHLIQSERWEARALESERRLKEEKSA